MRSAYQTRQAQTAPAVDVDELKQQLAAAQAKYTQLGGDSYQYADRMMPQDYEAQRVHQQINSLARRIQAAGG
jgi:cell division FtsZ-interacting protein ZapD